MNHSYVAIEDFVEPIYNYLSEWDVIDMIYFHE